MLDTYFLYRIVGLIEFLDFHDVAITIHRNGLFNEMKHQWWCKLWICERKYKRSSKVTFGSGQITLRPFSDISCFSYGTQVCPVLMQSIKTRKRLFSLYRRMFLVRSDAKKGNSGSNDTKWSREIHCISEKHQSTKCINYFWNIDRNF